MNPVDAGLRPVRTEPPWYPPPGPDLRAADEDQVVRWIGGRLMDAAPEGRRRIDLTVRLTAAVEEIALAVVMPDGAAARMEPPPDVSPLLFELRNKKYMRDRGTWLSLRLVIEPDGEYRVSYNFDLDPLWDPPLDADVWHQDFEAYFRDAEWTPAWYREGIKGEPAGERPPDEPDALLKNVADYLKFTLPAGWDHAQLQYRALGDHEESGAVVHSITGTGSPWTPPDQVLDLLRRHRAASLSDGRGTWVSLKYAMKFPDSVQAQFNATEDPGFRERPPDWLRQGAEGA